MSNGEALKTAINGTRVAEVLRVKETDKSIYLLFRVHHKRIFVGIMEYTILRKQGWEEHLSQRYFVKGKKLVYGWEFILRSDDLDKATIEVAKLLKTGTKVILTLAKKWQTADGGVNSMPLIGAGSHRTANIVFDPRLPGPDKGGPSHRGAYSVGETG